LAGPYNASTPTIHFGAPITLNKGAKFFKYGRWATNSWHFLADWVNKEKGGINVNGIVYALKISYANDDSDSETAVEVAK
jgi:ABC-type branched-subunit amino acid transport system substrate-binding protein